MLAEITDAGRAVVEAATADLVAADFALGRHVRGGARQLSALLRRSDTPPVTSGSPDASVAGVGVERLACHRGRAAAGQEERH